MNQFIFNWPQLNCDIRSRPKLNWLRIKLAVIANGNFHVCSTIEVASHNWNERYCENTYFFLEEFCWWVTSERSTHGGYIRFRWQWVGNRWKPNRTGHARRFPRFGLSPFTFDNKKSARWWASLENGSQSLLLSLSSIAIFEWNKNTLAARICIIVGSESKFRYFHLSSFWCDNNERLSSTKMLKMEGSTREKGELEDNLNDVCSLIDNFHRRLNWYINHHSSTHARTPFPLAPQPQHPIKNSTGACIEYSYFDRERKHLAITDTDSRQGVPKWRDAMAKIWTKRCGNKYNNISCKYLTKNRKKLGSLKLCTKYQGVTGLRNGTHTHIFIFRLAQRVALK